MRVGIATVAYNAETTLERLLDRVRASVDPSVCEVLVLDDHSSDRTYEVALAYRRNHDDLPLQVMRQPRNLGYGGNQKSAYYYAMSQGWDVVVLLHGDAQYPPERIADLVEPIVSGIADAVFGSRMISPDGARAGGMPLYKRVGNRVLSTIQNRLTGLRLSEWHSGFRAYRVSALGALPLDLNSDDFDFDTEIILQLHAAGYRIAEIPIPTHYGTEICYVNGLAYAHQVVRHSARFRLGRRGFGAGQLATAGPEYSLKADDLGSHGRIAEFMRGRPPSRVLDLGCGPGWLAERMTRAGHQVVGVDLVESQGVGARMSRFVQCDLERGLTLDRDECFDVVVAADVLEHLRDPERLLREALRHLRPGGLVLASVPNVSHWYVRARVALGLFSYDQRGILDRSHIRFFTRRSFLQLARRCQLEVVTKFHTGLPLEPLGFRPSSAVSRFVKAVDAVLVQLRPTLFAYQFVYLFAPVAHVADATSAQTEGAGP